MKSMLFILSLLFMSSPALAQDAFDRAKDLVDLSSEIDRFSQETHDETMVDFGTEYPHEFDPATLEDDGVLATTSATNEAESYSVIGDRLSETGPDSIDNSLLDYADNADSGPNSFVSMEELFEVADSGGQCTVDSVAAAPPFMQICDRSRSIVSRTCDETAVVTATVDQVFQCSDYDPSAGSCEEVFQEQACILSEQVCLSIDLNGNCLGTLDTYECSSGSLITTSATEIGAPVWHSPVTSYERVCPTDLGSLTCESLGETCTGGSANVFIGTLVVPVACMETTESFSCLSATFEETCAAPIDPSCSLQSSDCYEFDENYVCLNFEDTYQCGGGSGTFDASCPAVTVCVGETCLTVDNDPNEEFASSAAHVVGLNDMVESDEIDISQYVDQEVNGIEAADIEFFSGSDLRCAKATFGTYNCCRDTGWALGIFTECSSNEYALAAAQEDGRTVYIRTYCSAKFLVCVEKKRVYCVYDSKLARIFSTEAFRILDIAYECRALTYAEIEAVDFSQMDLSDAYADMIAGAGAPDTDALTDAILANITVNLPTIQENYDE